MNLFVIGLNHKTAPVEIREKYAFREDEIPEALQSLKGLEEILECAILTTCNRVELCVLTLNAEVENLFDFLARKNPCQEGDRDQLRKHLYVHQNEKALEHICRVSAGLDSLVIGEPQIFGQVKDAYNLSVENGTAGSVFKSIFPQIFALVKKVRTTTEVGNKNISVSYAAISLARTIFKNLEGRSVMILGAGEMGEQTVRNLIGQGAKTVYVSNRTFEKAVRLAEQLDGIPIMLYEVCEYLPMTDIVISSLSADGFVLNSAEVGDARRSRDRKPLVFIDISVPRSINPDITTLQDVYLYNIDDLKSVAESNLSTRAEEAHKASRIIADRVQAMLNHLKADDIEPTVVFLKNASEEIRAQEWSKLLENLDVPDPQKRLIETFGRAVANRIAHQTIMKIREYINTMKFR